MSFASDLDQFIGTEAYYVNPLYRWMQYTDGVKYFAQHAGGGAYWLLDIIGTEIKELYDHRGFLCINLKVHENESCDLVVEDGDGSELRTRRMSFTDCPVGAYKFFLTGNVLMLASEY